jgi:arylsulfatase A-like enzyme
MNKKALLSLAITAFSSGSLFSQEKPNILLITTDQQSYNMMSCMGNKWLKTTNMDRIAGMGYRFEKCYCVNPVSQPSRFSLLTGHYASEVGVKHNSTAYNEVKVKQIASEYGLGNIFRNAGYRVICAGKTHMYETKDLSEYGFKSDNTDPYNGPADYAEEILAEYGKGTKKKPFLLFLSFINPHDICLKAGADRRYPNKISKEEAHATRKLLEAKNKLSPEEYRSQIPPRAYNFGPIAGEQEGMVELDIESRGWTSAQWDLYNWMYHRLTESVDKQIGRVLDALEKTGLVENTIIVFTSDHGEMNGAHGLILKNVLFEECQRVPLIFAGKGIKKNYADKTTLVCNGLDFIPTICDLAGIPYSKGLPGISLKPFLTGQLQKSVRKYIITESYNGYQINDGRYKYSIYELPGHPEMLTDLFANPGETNNYATDKSYNEIKSTLRKQLMDNLTKRGLTPLTEDRTISNIRKKEKVMSGEEIDN